MKVNTQDIAGIRAALNFAEEALRTGVGDAERSMRNAMIRPGWVQLCEDGKKPPPDVDDTDQQILWTGQALLIERKAPGGVGRERATLAEVDLAVVKAVGKSLHRLAYACGYRWENSDSPMKLDSAALGPGWKRMPKEHDKCGKSTYASVDGKMLIEYEQWRGGRTGERSTRGQWVCHHLFERDTTQPKVDLGERFGGAQHPFKTWTAGTLAALARKLPMVGAVKQEDKKDGP